MPTWTLRITGRVSRSRKSAGLLKRQKRKFPLADPHRQMSERTYDYIIACRSLQSSIKSMEVVDDFESRPC